MDLTPVEAGNLLNIPYPELLLNPAGWQQFVARMIAPCDDLQHAKRSRIMLKRGCTKSEAIIIKNAARAFCDAVMPSMVNYTDLGNQKLEGT